MALERRDNAGAAVITELASAISASDLSIPVVSSTGWPSGGASGPFFVVIDEGLAGEEKIEVQSRTGATLTVASTGKRGADDTTATTHAAGAEIKHCFTAQDADEANRAVANTIGKVTTKGDMLAATGANAFDRVSTGSDSTLLVADAGQSTGVKWAQAVTASITDGAVTNAKLASNAADTAKIADAAVTTAKIADDAVTAAKIADAAIDSIGKITAAVQNVLAPVGSIVAYGGSAAPTGWLLCQGQVVSRTTYDDLFAIIGESYGAGDGSTTFALPDLRKRFPLGLAASGTGAALGETGGAIDHAHGLSTGHALITFSASSPYVRLFRRSGVSSWNQNNEVTTSLALSSASGGQTTAVGLGGDSDTANPPYLAVNYIIRVAS